MVRDPDYDRGRYIGEEYTLAERRKLLDWVIRPALRSVAGVADVSALGGYIEAWQVVPNTAAMAAALPQIDHFAAANSLQSLAALEPKLARL